MYQTNYRNFMSRGLTPANASTGIRMNTAFHEAFNDHITERAKSKNPNRRHIEIASPQVITSSFFQSKAGVNVMSDYSILSQNLIQKSIYQSNPMQHSK